MAERKVAACIGEEITVNRFMPWVLLPKSNAFVAKTMQGQSQVHDRYIKRVRLFNCALFKYAYKYKRQIILGLRHTARINSHEQLSGIC